jgi:hypothetical protein
VSGWNARIPVPPTITRWSVPPEGVEVVEGSTEEVEVGGVDVEAGGEPEELPVPIAFALKASNCVPGFTAKTIPC